MSTLSSTSQSPPLYYWSAIVWLFLAPALGGFLFGYDIGGTSYALLELQGFPTSESMSLQEDPLKTGWFVAAPSAGALLGTAILLYLDQYHQQSQHDRNRNNHNNKGAPLRRWWSRIRSVVTFQFLFDKPLGRKTELYYASILYALGGCLQYSAMAITKTVPFAIVLFGRCLYGIGIGLAMHGGPTYLAETMPPSIRGMVVGAKEIAIVLGILCGYIVGNHYCTDHGTGNNGDNHSDHGTDGWANVYGWTVVGALAMMIISHTIPESPRFLVCSCADEYENDDNDQELKVEWEPRISAEVLESLECVWHPQRAQEEHAKLMELYTKQHKSNNTPTASSSPSLSQLLSDPVLRPALRPGLGLVILQQITGQPSVLSYATPILSSVPGLDSNASVVLAAFKVVATSVSVILVERYGRKTLLQAGCSMMLGALLVLAVAFQETNESGTTSDGIDSNWIGMEAIEEDVDTTTLDAKSLLALVGMFAYIAGYQIGFGPITWLMISEVFPLSVRATMVALAVQTNFALNALVQVLVPLLESSLGMSQTFLVFGGLSAYSIYFCTHSVPETKGLTLEEIEETLSLLGAGEETDRGGVSAVSGNQEQPGILSETELLLRSSDTSKTRRRTSQSTEHQRDDDDGERIRLLP